MAEHRLIGCRPAPLASYLKGLAVLRLVGEQADPDARGFWQDDAFVLRSALDEEALLRFFLESYRPTPVVAPWNGGSGFHASVNQMAIEAIGTSESDRFRAYRLVIDTGRRLLDQLGIEGKPTKIEKPILLESCRAAFPDDALPWLDAAFLLTSDGARYPPLLGTGGNDGRLDFTNNFMQRLLDIMDPTGAPAPTSRELLRAALLDEPTDDLGPGAIGQFHPAGAGGANAGPGFDGDSRLNPWDFVLMIEGTVVFATAAVRKMEQPAGGALSYPFTVRATGVGYPSAAATDEGSGASRGEMWLPAWSRPVGAPEMHALFSEGRVHVSGRPARNGVDFARAAATLGVDRGIRAFQRYGFHVRNGLSYLATPLERVLVRDRPNARLLDPLDHWMDTYRRRATAEHAPSSARRALTHLEHAVLDLCRRGGPDRVMAVLLALGRCERTMARSLTWASDPKHRLSPVPPLASVWLDRADDGSAEFRLAASLASLLGSRDAGLPPLRCHLEPVGTTVRDDTLRVWWDDRAHSDVVWSHGDLTAFMNAILVRRLLLSQQAGARSYVDRAVQPARLDDVAAFIEGRTDDRRLAALLWGAALIDWPASPRSPLPTRSDGPVPPALFGLLKLCHSGRPYAGAEDAVPLTPRLHRLAASGDSVRTSQAAARRLRASGYPPALDLLRESPAAARRAAAAVLFPLTARDLRVLRRSVLRPTPHLGGNHP